jgi:hypothetical protein
MFAGPGLTSEQQQLWNDAYYSGRAAGVIDSNAAWIWAMREFGYELTSGLTREEQLQGFAEWWHKRHEAAGLRPETENHGCPKCKAADHAQAGSYVEGVFHFKCAACGHEWTWREEPAPERSAC